MGQSDYPPRSWVLLRILFTLTRRPKEIHTPSNSAVRRVRRPRARGPTLTRSNLTNSLTAWLTSSHRLYSFSFSPSAYAGSAYIPSKIKVAWFLISINIIIIQKICKYKNNKKKKKLEIIRPVGFDGYNLSDIALTGFTVTASVTDWGNSFHASTAILLKIFV